MDQFTPEEIAVLKEMAQERLASQGGGGAGAAPAAGNAYGDMGADLASMLGGGAQ